MKRTILLAPGPSMSVELANFLIPQYRGFEVGVINNAFELAPWADFLVANDINWWARNPAARDFAGQKYTASRVHEIERVSGGGAMSSCNSGVVALEVAVRRGSKEIYMFGFDMHGSHFFGKYSNGCVNTSDEIRERHQRQFKNWMQNRKIKVINCTHGSQLRAIPLGTL